MKDLENMLVRENLSVISDEIKRLKKQLLYEKQQRQHWQKLAMIFHDALWEELRRTQQVVVTQKNCREERKSS